MMAEEKSEAEAENANGSSLEQERNAADPGGSSRSGEQLKALFRMGAHQYCAGIGDRITVPDFAKRKNAPSESWLHAKRILADVLMVMGDRTIVGTPTVPGARVTLELSAVRRGERVINFKRRRRKHSSKRTKGHRGYLLDFVVTNLEASGGEQGASPAAGS